MPFYQSRGRLPRKRFTTSLRPPSGGIYYEHYFTADGFTGAASLQYLIRAPSRVLRIEGAQSCAVQHADVPLSANLLFLVSRLSRGGDFLAARLPALAGQGFVFSVAKPDAPMTGFYRNAFADEVVLCTQGSGRLQSTFGELVYRELDVIVVPRGDTVRWMPDSGVAQSFVILESASPVRVPPGFLKPNGQFRDNAGYHERDIRAPELQDPVDEEGEFPIRVKMGDRIETHILDHHPFDVVGWDGHFFPFAINLEDYEPLSGRIALMPDLYQLFVTDDTMITCITPRRLADHPEAAKMQPYHQNIDYDEILYRFSGRTGGTEPEPGTFTLHPRASVHGPKPGFENLPTRTYQDAYGFMIDTRILLRPTVEAMAAVDEAYARTYLESTAVRQG